MDIGTHGNEFEHNYTGIHKKVLDILRSRPTGFSVKTLPDRWTITAVVRLVELVVNEITAMLPVDAAARSLIDEVEQHKKTTTVELKIEDGGISETIKKLEKAVEGILLKGREFDYAGYHPEAMEERILALEKIVEAMNQPRPRRKAEKAEEKAEEPKQQELVNA